jgi:hypothetical protein
VPVLNWHTANAVGVLGVNALLGKRATATLYEVPDKQIPDEQYVAHWTALLANQIKALRTGLN